MEQGKKCENLGLGFVRSTSFGRKRVTLLNTAAEDTTTPNKRFCNQSSFYEKSSLEALPKDILIKIVCGVDHADLRSLFHVSSAIREATLIAKRLHFEYSTPKKTLHFRSAVDMEDLSDAIEIEPPNALRISKIATSLLRRKKLANISVALFASDDEENWPRRELFGQMETEK